MSMLYTARQLFKKLWYSGFSERPYVYCSLFVLDWPQSLMVFHQEIQHCPPYDGICLLAIAPSWEG